MADQELTTLTADIVASFVGSNSVTPGALISAAAHKRCCD